MQHAIVDLTAASPSQSLANKVKSSLSDTMLTQDEPNRSRTPWMEVVEAKRAIRSQHIKRHQDKTGNLGIDTKITELADISTLTQLLESKKLSAEDIITAYIQKYVSTST